MSAPIRITRAGRLGRAEFPALGSTVTILVTSPGSIARAALAVRRRLGLVDAGGPAGRARAADLLAADAAHAAGCGVLLSIGGDIATAGPAPAHGWRIRVAGGGAAQEADVIHLAAGGLASVRSAGKGSVTVAAGSCQEARTLALAAIERGGSAAQWVTSLHLAARLAGADGSVVHTGHWAAAPAAA